MTIRRMSPLLHLANAIAEIVSCYLPWLRGMAIIAFQPR